MKTEIKIVVADDHPLVRDGLRRAIEATAILKVVAEAGDGQTALDRILTLKPDVALLDIDMPLMSGFDVARALREQGATTAIIFLTIHREEDFFNEALDLGAQGYVLKDSAASDIVTGINAVAAGEHFTSPAMTSYLINRSRRAADFRRAKPTLNDLTPTERHVLRLIADYKTSKEIADELGVSHRTIETHRTNISTKLELRGSHSLMKFALSHKDEL
ncbi:MAG TPA: response regulator transcription factor [Blastocatellia bacterium]